MSASMVPDLGSLSFWRIADVPFDTYVAALDSWLRTRHGGELWLGGSSCSLRLSTTATWARAGSRSAWPADRCTRRCACGWTSTAGPHPPPRWSSSRAGSSGPQRIISGPDVSCLTR
jgi:hypothetical protein